MRYFVRGPWGHPMHRQMWEAARCGQADVEKDLTLAVDVLETKDAYVVLAALPGMKSEDMNIEITGNQLKLEGTLAEESEENVEWLLRERSSGKISRTLQFRDELDASKAEAQLKDGLLRLRLPKAEESLPKTVKVTAS
jgi:HSP20 family protein